MTTIRYFIPEDGDIESEPNVFLAPKSRHPGAPPAFGQVRDAFPLPGQYHFRFKSALIPGSEREKGAMPVWMDFSEERQAVPTWKGTIVSKVTRINMEDDDDSIGDDDDDDDFPSQVPASAPAAAPVPVPMPLAPRSHAGSVGGSVASIDDLFDTPAPAPSAVPAAPSTADTAESLLNFDHQPSAPPSHHHHPHQPAPSTAHNDFFGMTAPTPTQTPPTGIQSAPTSGGYPGNPTMYSSQPPMGRHQQQQQQQQNFNAFSTGQSQQNQGAFGDLGTPWKS